MKLKKLLAFGLALVMCLAMAACGTNPDEKTDAEPVSITVTENWDFSVGFYPVITPMVSSTYGAGFWSRNFYNTLVSYDDNGKIQGELAETWEISDDGKTYTFHLRDGVKFSDGTPLTSEAVKMTLEAVVTHLGPQNGAFGKLTTLFDNLETPDEKTFVIYADVVPEIGECQRQLMMGAEFCYDAIANPKNYDMLRISNKSYTYTSDNQYALL